MCCSGDKTVKATETAQAAFTQTLTDSFKTAFANKQDILNKIVLRMKEMMFNPQGLDPKTLALMKTTASDTVARETEAAQAAANAYLATHGGPTLGSGVAAQIKGQIAAAGAGERARELSGIDIQSGLLQNENFWKSISGLTAAANEENPEAIANSEIGSANSVGELSKAYTASKFAGMQAFGSLLSGISGLATAVTTGIPKFGGTKAGGGGSAPGPPA